MNFPHHNYLGPGNKMENGQPVDSDDSIALKHDQDYEQAKTAKDILKADVEAIKAFNEDWKTHDNWHSLIGKYGLLTKHSVEIKIGKIIYPKVMDNTIDKNDRKSFKIFNVKEIIQKSAIMENILGEKSTEITEENEFVNFVRNSIGD